MTLGCNIEDVPLDLSCAPTRHSKRYGRSHSRANSAPSLPALRKTVKETVVWNIERGLALDGPAIARAIGLRSEVFTKVATVLEQFE